jgi:pimeloyl-ACP methyl ester carboxylesterase
MVPIDDTALAVTDIRGPGRPVVYLNEAYAGQRPWRSVIAELGADWRHITYDERARGKSKRSSDYSFEACLRDLDAVLEATGVDRPLLVGWSYGPSPRPYARPRPPTIRGSAEPMADGLTFGQAAAFAAWEEPELSATEVREAFRSPR